MEYISANVYAEDCFEMVTRFLVAVRMRGLIFILWILIIGSAVAMDCSEEASKYFIEEKLQR